MSGDPQAFAGTDRFVIERRLGAGGMGVVYQAHDRERGATVALKALRHLDPTSVSRFKREFRALADLAHRNLLRLGELFCEREQWFFTMELVSGQDFLSYVRPSSAQKEEQDISPTAETGQLLVRRPHAATWPEALGCLDEARLRTAVAQLAQGITALHAAHKIHRDIKPSNILVTADDRVVLLDFGLVADVLSKNDDSDLGLVGTAAYMAPEQATGGSHASQPVGPEADWYSVGVLLYEALTGRPPFLGAPLQVLLDKQQLEPPSPRALVPDVPGDLEALCVELLRKDPRARPTGHAVLAAMGIAVDRARSASSFPQATPFVGRSPELRVLADAFRDSREGAVTVFVHGESGLGKTTLVRHFLDRLEHAAPALVLRGRCYERESVPFKALDSLVDALSLHLARAHPRDTELVLPRDMAVLPRLFPAFRRVPRLEHLPAPALPNPHELRRRASAALRELLARVAERNPLVLYIDDFQWTDADSLTLLSDLLHPPEAPRLFLVATVQTLADLGAGQDPVGAVSGILGDVRHIHLPSLSPEDSRELATLLLSESPTSPLRDATAIATEAAGHPLFIHELARHMALSSDSRVALLDEALWLRVEHLERTAQDLLQLLCVAGTPLGRATVEKATGLDPEECSRFTSILRAASLLRGAGGSTDALEPYHNRIRDAVLAHLPSAILTQHHRRLADVLETTQTSQKNPLLLVRHLEAAGLGARAATQARTAADLAFEALAFDQAAQLYRTTLRLGQHDDETRRALLVRLGDALANSARGAQAAQAYQEAAASSTAFDALELYRRASEQLLQAGHIDQGLAAIRSSLGAVGMTLPEATRLSIPALALKRARLRLRGLGFVRRDESQVPQDLLLRIDTCWSASTGLSHIDVVRGAAFQTRGLLFALQAGEPFRIARALAAEAAFSSAGGTRSLERTTHLLREAETLALELDHPQALARLYAVRGTAALLQGRFAAARRQLETADVTYRQRCTGVAWEIDAMRLNIVASLGYLGELGELSRRVDQHLYEAKEKADLYAGTVFRLGEANLAWLARDRPEQARQEALHAITQYSLKSAVVQTFQHLLAEVRIDLYEGLGAVAHARMSKGWPALHKSLLLHVQHIRIVMWNLRATAALASTRATPSGRDARTLLRAAERDAERVARENDTWAQALATCLRAGIKTAAGDTYAALPLYARAATEFSALDMALYAAAARRRQGELLGAREGHLLCEASDAWMRQHGVENPARMTRMLAP
jgi:serine/threonine protein kinase